MKNIKVIVVDDSALMRRVISDMINMEADMEVIEIAKNGSDLIDKITTNMPHVVTLDVEMPVMDGISALKELKKRGINIPVIMLSSISRRGTELTMECLEAGAFDFIPKPSGNISLDIGKVKDELVQKIRLAYNKNSIIVSNNDKNNNLDKNNSITNNTFRESNMVNETANIQIKNNLKRNTNSKIDVVLIGASTGGPKALYTLVTALPENLGVPVLIVQHMPVGFTKAFADRLDQNSRIKVEEGKDLESIERDTVYIAPGGYHMEVGSDKKIHLNTEPSIWGVRPAVDKLFISATKVYGGNILSVVLTGMGRDGAQGTIDVKKSGGVTISEDKSTCTIYGMPKVAFETGMVDEVLPITEIASEIVRIVKSNR